jgi:heavy metal efflux system protein
VSEKGARVTWWPGLCTEAPARRRADIGTLLAAAGWRRGPVIVFLVVALFAAAAGLTQRIITKSPDAAPLVEILTQSEERSAEFTERSITNAIRAELATIGKITRLRSVSLAGVSDVQLQFADDVTQAEAKQQVTDGLTRLPPLPGNVSPLLASRRPATELVHYRVIAPPGYSAVDLATLQDRVLARRLRALPQVVAVGGASRDAQDFIIALDTDRLSQLGLSVSQVTGSLGDAEIAGTEETIDFAPHRATLHGVGHAASAAQIADLRLAGRDGTPARLGDISVVTVSAAPRVLVATHRDQGVAVDGVVLLEAGEPGQKAMNRIAADFDRINTSDILPPGMRIECIDGLGYQRFVETGSVLTRASTVVVFAVLLVLAIRLGLRLATSTDLRVRFSRRADAAKHPRGGAKLIDG